MTKFIQMNFQIILVIHPYLNSLSRKRAMGWLKIRHCVKSVQIRSFFWSAFSFIWTEYRKIWTRKNSVFGNFSCSEKTAKLLDRLCNFDLKIIYHVLVSYQKCFHVRSKATLSELLINQNGLSKRKFLKTRLIQIIQKTS